jgi:multiple sugar transport system substrate-binding protein
MAVVLTGILVTSVVAGRLSSAVAQQASLRMISTTGGSGRFFAAMVNDFERESGIKVELIQYPYAEAREKQLLELSSRTGNLDVVVVDDQIWLAEFHRFLEPLEPYVERDQVDLKIYVPAMLELFRFRSPTTRQMTLYGLPVRIGGWVLIFRKDLFDEAGLKVPLETMDDFLDAAKKLTKAGVYGFAPAFKQGNFLVAQWIPFLRSFGGEVLDKDLRKAAFNSKAGMDATQFMVDLLQKHKVVPPGSITYEHDNVITAMQQGLTAMAITYSPYFLEMNDPQKSRFAGKFGVTTRLPYAKGSGLKAGVTMLTGWGLGISRDSRRKDTAWRLVKYAASPPVQASMAIKYANAPTVVAVFKNSVYKSLYPDAEAVMSTLQGARPRPGVPQWTQIEDILASELSAALSGTKAVKQALDDAERRVNQALSR